MDPSTFLFGVIYLELSYLFLEFVFLLAVC